MFKWIGIGVGVLAAILLAFIGLAYFFPEFRTATRDIAIVLLGIFQLISTILLIAILFALLFVLSRLEKIAGQSLIPSLNITTTKVNELIDLVSPRIDTATAQVTEIVENARRTSDKVRDTTVTTATTTVFVAERVASPIIRASGLIAGVRAAATALARRGAEPEESH